MSDQVADGNADLDGDFDPDYNDIGDGDSKG